MWSISAFGDTRSPIPIPRSNKRQVSKPAKGLRCFLAMSLREGAHMARITPCVPGRYLTLPVKRTALECYPADDDVEHDIDSKGKYKRHADSRKASHTPHLLLASLQYTEKVCLNWHALGQKSRADESKTQRRCRKRKTPVNCYWDRKLLTIERYLPEAGVPLPTNRTAQASTPACATRVALLLHVSS